MKYIKRFKYLNKEFNIDVEMVSNDQKSPIYKISINNMGSEKFNMELEVVEESLKSTIENLMVEAEEWVNLTFKKRPNEVLERMGFTKIS
jgi:hypothetical protein